MSREHTRIIFNPLTRQPWIGLEGESGGQGGTTPEPAGDPAPDQDPTANPDPADQTPEQGTEDTKPEKLFTQEEMDAAIAKRLARAERQWKREQATRTPEKPGSTEPLNPGQFETWEDYAEALSEQKAEQKAQELTRRQEVQRRQIEIESTFADREDTAREKYSDYDQVARGPHIVTDFMAVTIKESEIGPDIAYWLGQNPKESNRIAALPPLQQAREIGKIEAKLTDNPPTKKTTSAPDPISPVKSRGGTPTFETTDPRSDKMSDSDWIEAENRRERQRLKG